MKVLITIAWENGISLGMLHEDRGNQATLFQINKYIGLKFAILEVQFCF